MPKVSPIQTNFGGGEFSPTMGGRVELDRYKQALAVCENHLPSIQGALIKRSGSMYVASTKTGSKKARLVRFEFSVTQAYMLEFGDQYIRFYRDNGQILSLGIPYEIATPYLEADLFQLKITQSADVLYIVHPDYAQRTLSRTGHTSWTLSTMSFTDGPYDTLNATTTTLTPSSFAVGVGVTLTASSIVGINGGTGFKTTDIGRYIRIREGSTWGYVKITAWTSTTVVTVQILSTLTNVTAKAFWRLGIWSDTTGYPATVTFHEDRLGFAGTPSYPQRLDLSVTGDYTNFAPTDTAGVVTDDKALSLTFSAGNVNVVRWLLSDEKGLIAGTVGGEWIVRPSSQSESLTPTNISAKQSTAYGSADVQALQVGKSGIFVQRAGRKVREITYFFDVDGFRATDLSVLAEHITQSGVVELANQKEPQPLVWAVRNDGVLAGMTYERDVDNFKAGWHRQILGGVSDINGNDAVVESAAVIPSADGTRDDLWIIVKRYVNGATVRHVEYLTKLFNDEMEQKEAFFVDCGLSYDAPLAITAITKANPGVITSAAHGLNNNDKILASDIYGMTELNDNSYYVKNKTANTFEIALTSGGTSIDTSGTGYTAYISSGYVRKYVTTLSGLTHLEGQSVAILGDGAVIPNQTVTAGAITLPVTATTLHVGLPYSGKGQMMRLDAGSADGTAIGKTRRTHRVGFMLYRSLGLKIGMAFDSLTNIIFRRGSDGMSRAPALYTGIISEEIEADYDFENQICWESDQPLPFMLLAIMPQMVEQDR